MYTRRLVPICVFALLLFVTSPSFGKDQSSRTEIFKRVQQFRQLQQARINRSEQTGARLSMHKRLNGGTVAQTFLSPSPMASLPATNRIGFLSALQISAGGDPSGTAVVGDFNGDGKKDIATAVYKPSTEKVSVSVALGNGDGTFQASKLTASSANDPYLIELLAADVNGDHKDDLILFCEYATDPTTWASEGKVEVFISNGTGTFAAPVAYTTGAAYVVAASALDLNGDHVPDLMAVSPNGQVITMLNNGNGTFQTPVSTSYAGALSNAVIADLNGDGKPDFAGFAKTTYTLQIFLATGGGFLAPMQLPTGLNYVCSIAAGDLTGDGKPELVTSSCGATSNNVTVYQNNGDGSFIAGSSVWAGFFTQGVAIADINNDAKNDVVALNEDSGDLTVLLGNGDGTLQPPNLCSNASCNEGGYVVGGSPWTNPAVADFNGDGNPDVVATDDQFSFVYLQGYGDGTFRSATNYYGPLPEDGSSQGGLSLAEQDLNGDGYPDITVANSSISGTGAGGLTVFLNDKKGGLQPGVTVGIGTFQYVAIGSFHGNANADIAATTNSPDSVQVFLNNGDGSFRTPKSYPVDLDDPNASPQGIVAADLNGDSKTDLTVINLNGTISVLLNDGQGGFSAPVKYAVPSGGYQLAVGDLDNDGTLDVVAADFVNDSIEFLRGHGDGTFDAAQSIAVGTSPDGIAVADLNGDHNVDIAVAHWDDNTIGVLIGKGDGTFNPPVYYPASLQATSDILPNAAELHVADIDGDGNLDLVWENDAFGTVAVLYGDGQGNFAGPVEFPVASSPWGLAIADVNLDGAPDVVTSNKMMLGATVLLNAGGVWLQGNATPNPAQSGQSVTLAATVAGAVKGATATPTGTVEFDLGSNVIGTVTLTNGSASVDAPSLAPGTYKASARYSGDKLYRPRSIDISFIVNKLATTTTVTSSLNPSMAGDPVTLTAIIAPVSATGTVTFKDGTTTLGSPVTLDSNGKATFTSSSLSAFTHSITAVYSGDPIYAESTSDAFSQVVKPLPGSTATTLTSSANPSVIGRSVTFTAGVTSTTQGAITGTVTFKDAATSLGTAPLDAGAKATFATSALTVATHSITAVYNGDSNYGSSTSIALPQVVLPSDPDYTLSANPTTIDITAGQTGTTTIKATADDYFDGTVSFSCGTLPRGVTCQFTPATLNPTSGHPATTTLVIKTTAQTAALAVPPNPARPTALVFLASLSGIGVFGTLFDFSGRKRYLMILAGVLLLAVTLGLSGCGGGSQATSTPPTNPNGTPLGQSTVQITATATAGSTGGNTAPHPLALTINVSK